MDLFNQLKALQTVEDTLFPATMLIFTLLSIYPIFKIGFIEWRKKYIYPWT